MYKKFKTLIIVCSIVLVFTLAVPALATPPTEVSGTYDYIPTITNIREAGGNVFWEGVDEWETWTGNPGFDGSGEAEWVAKINRSGEVWGRIRSTITGTLFESYSGTMVVQLVGKKPLNEDWSGTWVIISGTDQLAGAHGQGTWWGPGFDGDPTTTDVFYEGQVHLDPN